MTGRFTVPMLSHSLEALYRSSIQKTHDEMETIRFYFKLTFSHVQAILNDELASKRKLEIVIFLKGKLRVDEWPDTRPLPLRYAT